MDHRLHLGWIVFNRRSAYDPKAICTVFFRETECQICRLVRCSDARRTPSRIKKRDSQSPQMICQGPQAGVPPSEGFVPWACMECQGTAIQLVTGAVGTNHTFWKYSAAARWVLSFDPRCQGLCGSQKKILSLCRCGVERVLPSQLPGPRSDLRKLSRSVSIVCPAIAFANRLCNQSGQWGAVL